jgi:ATP-binding cassette, subfamily B, bacterial PglK
MIYSKIFKLLKFFPKKQKIHAVIILFLSVLTMCLEIVSVSLIVPLTSSILEEGSFDKQNFINKFIYTLYEFGEFKNLAVFCLVLFAIFFSLRIFFNLFLKILQSLFSFKIFEFLTNKILKIYLEKKWSFFTNKNTAEIMRDILEETGVFRSSVILPLTSLISESFILVGIITLLLFYNTFFTILVIIIFLVIGLGYRHYFKNRLNILASNRQKFSTKVTKNILEIFKLIKEIKLSFTEKFFFNNFTQNNSNYIKTNFTYNLISLIPRYLLEFIILLIFFSLVGYKYISDGNLINLIPTLSLYLVAAFRIMPGIIKILGTFQSIDWGSRSAETLYDLITSNKENKSFLSAKDIKILDFRKIIEFKGINFNYEDKKIIKDFNDKIEKNDIVGIIGKSGSGKTTLVNILMGLLNPTEGKITVDDKDISKNLKGWQKNIFLVQQDNFILDDSIKNNITLGEDKNFFNLERYNKSIKEASLKEFIDSLPAKDNTITGEDGIKISGGQKQRLSIARALYHDPEILVLDEATSSLDVATEGEILDSLHNIKGKKTIIIITHRESSLRLCNRIIRLD